jgi:putative transport protein
LFTSLVVLKDDFVASYKVVAVPVDVSLLGALRFGRGVVGVGISIVVAVVLGFLLLLLFGIILGVALGSIPFALPGLSQPFKLGIAGGTLIIAILMGAFGTKWHLVTYTTSSANLMIREIGISLFLAAVGFGAGGSFVETLLDGGYVWIGYGVIITLLPLLLIGFIARKGYKLDYFTLMGLIAGSTTDPPALAYATSQSSANDRAAVAYSTVYPLTMFLRVLTGQLMILLFL